MSWCPELDIASQGKDVEEAICKLKEAVELYPEDEETTIAEVDPILTTTFEVVYDSPSHSVST